MKRSIKEILMRSIILLVGLCIAHLGVTLLQLAKLGSDPFNVFVRGLFNTLQSLTGLDILTHGITHMSICFLIIIALLVIDRTYIKVGTLICMVCGGPIIDFFTWLLKDIVNDNNSLTVRIITLTIGCVILAYGMTIVIKSDAGTGPNDLVAIVISDKAHFRFGITRIVTDALFVIVGFFLGASISRGDINIGTIICMFLIGSVAELFLPINEKIIKKILG